mmetsp:Transcript_14679/g.16243  ORF Transcript_14679/g.16243 Transcript_14679/m.16243 type:complete len:235 (-) Transcript_14679:59-763(-)
MESNMQSTLVTLLTGSRNINITGRTERNVHAAVVKVGLIELKQIGGNLTGGRLQVLVKNIEGVVGTAVLAGTDVRRSQFSAGISEINGGIAMLGVDVELTGNIGAILLEHIGGSLHNTGVDDGVIFTGVDVHFGILQVFQGIDVTGLGKTGSFFGQAGHTQSGGTGHAGSEGSVQHSLSTEEGSSSENGGSFDLFRISNMHLDGHEATSGETGDGHIFQSNVVRFQGSSMTQTD